MASTKNASFSKLLRTGVQSLDLDLPENVFTACETHQTLLAQWAPRINLVGNASPEITAESHFLDALALLRILSETTTQWTDIGSGAGFPGLPLAAALPTWSFQLVEPLSKRASFLQQVIARTNLTNTAITLGRSEEIEPASLPGVISRAVYPPPLWLEVAGALVKPGGWVVLMSASEPNDEVQTAAANARLTEIRRDAFTLPFGKASRLNILYQKRTE